MAPQRTRNLVDDSRSELSSTRERYSGLVPTQTNSKGRRNGTGTVGTASVLKEVALSNQTMSGSQDGPEDDKRVGLPKADDLRNRTSIDESAD